MSSETPSRLARRLRRILLLVPYAIERPGVSVEELSTKLGVKRAELIEDLNLLFMCGLPGYGPGDLIDVEFDEGYVYVRMADYFAAPLRLTPAEGLALYAGGAALASMPDMAEADALRRGLTKLARSLGAGDEGPVIDVRFERGPDAHLRTLRDALDAGKRVRLEYFSASSGELSRREVDPWALYAALGRWYLIAWDHSHADERMFRVDRVKDVQILADDAVVPADFDASRYRGAFREREGQPVASFEISPRASRWFEEYYPVRTSRAVDDGWRAIEIAYSTPQWIGTLLLSLGEDVRNIAPDEVMSAARAQAAAIAALYGG